RGIGVLILQALDRVAQVADGLDPGELLLLLVVDRRDDAGGSGVELHVVRAQEHAGEGGVVHPDLGLGLEVVGDVEGPLLLALMAEERLTVGRRSRPTARAAALALGADGDAGEGVPRGRVWSGCAAGGADDGSAAARCAHGAHVACSAGSRVMAQRPIAYCPSSSAVTRPCSSTRRSSAASQAS